MTRVLVTGAGGAAGVAVIQELQQTGHEAVAADPDPLAAGAALAAERSTSPLATDPGFVDALRTLVRTCGVDAVISTVSEEMSVLGQDPARVLGAPCWVSPVETVRTCIDKACFAIALDAAGVPTPATSSGDSPPPPGPWIVKPRFGRGSRDVHVADERDELEWARTRTPDAIVQTRCSGREFTVDLLVDHDGSVAAAVPR